MNTDRDVLEFSFEVGKRIWVYAQGNPAVMVAGAIVVGVTAVGYGGYKYGSKYGARLFEHL
jgi:hypothetical protein